MTKTTVKDFVKEARREVERTKDRFLPFLAVETDKEVIFADLPFGSHEQKEMMIQAVGERARAEQKNVKGIVLIVTAWYVTADTKEEAMNSVPPSENPNRQSMLIGAAWDIKNKKHMVMCRYEKGDKGKITWLDKEPKAYSIGESDDTEMTVLNNFWKTYLAQ